MSELEADSPFLPPKPDSLSIRIASQIREAMYQGELKPGDFLRELALAKAFQVSQATIREALAQLEHCGLVVRTPNRCTTVANLSQEELEEKLRVWCNLEQLAVLAACERASEEDLQNLGEIADLASGTVAATFAGIAQREFHHRIWRMAENRTLYRMLDQLTLPLFVFRLHIAGKAPASDHFRGVLNAIREKDRGAIVRAVQAYHGVDGVQSYAAAAAQE